MLKAKTSSMIATPGPIERDRVGGQKLVALLIMDPHAAVGGRMPTPRKLRPASMRIAPPNCMVTVTISIGRTVGQDVHEHDATPAGTLSALGENVVALLRAHDLTPHQPGVHGHQTYAYSDDHRLEPATQQRSYGGGQGSPPVRP